MRLSRVRQSILVTSLCLSILSVGCHTPEHPESARQRQRDFQKQQKIREQEGIYYNEEYSDSDDEKESLLQLAVGGVVVLVSGIWEFLSLPLQAAKFAGGERPSQAVRMMEDSSSADNRRAGINKLMEWDFARHDPYTRRFRQIAQFDTDPTVRAIAIRALNRARDPQATKIFIRALADPNEWVRLEGAKALANVPDMAAADPLLQLLNRVDENRDVRVAAADALKHYRTLPVARGLVGALVDRHFGVSWQARKSLRYLFNRDFKYDQAAWLAFLSSPASPVK